MKASEIREYREKQLAIQKGICPLCGREVLPEQAALDHCHRSGKVRRVLHRWCNSVLGRIENWSKRVGGINNIEFLKRVVVYLESETTDITHPSHGRKRRRRRTVTRKKR